MLHQSSLHCSKPFKISLFCMTAILHGSQSAGRRGGRAAEWARGRWLPASGCLARTGKEGRVLLQHSTVFPLHVSNSACYVPAVTQIERQYFYFWLLLLSLIDFPGHEEAVYIGFIQWLFYVSWNNLREDLHSHSQILFILLALVIVNRKMGKTIFEGIKVYVFI